MPRILIVEDEILQRTLLGTHFKGLGYEIVCAADAVDALQALLCEAFDLIVSDIDMPYLDGIEFLQAVRGDARTRDVPLIFLTGKSDEETRLYAMRQGANGFLVKPCSMAVLDETVDCVLDPPLDPATPAHRRYG